MSLNLILTIAIGIVIGWLLILLIRTIIPILIELSDFFLSASLLYTHIYFCPQSHGFAVHAKRVL